VLAALVALAGCASGPAASPSGSTIHVAARSASAVLEPSAYADAILTETNRVRAERDLADLTPSACAAEQAIGRAEALVGDPLEHASLKPVISACAPPSGLAAENLSRAAATPAEVVNAWLGSAGHANNLLSPQLTELGVGCVLDDSNGRQMLCSQVFLG